MTRPREAVADDGRGRVAVLARRAWVAHTPCRALVCRVPSSPAERHGRPAVFHCVTPAMPISAGAVLAAVAVAVYLHPLLTSFPHPYSSLTATPSDPQSLARVPPFPPDLSGPFAPNELLAQHATRLFEGRVVGAESVAVAPDGTLIMLDKYGYVHHARKSPTGEYQLLAEDDATAELLYIGPGRPLGFHVVEDGAALLVCDSLKGLLRVDLRAGGGAGAITVLANSLSSGSAGAGPQLGGNSHIINYANDLDVAADGTIYFSSSTASGIAQHPDGFYDTMRSFLLNMCCGDHTGRLLAHDPRSGATTEVLSGLWYANGVAVAHDEQSVLVRACADRCCCCLRSFFLRTPSQQSILGGVSRCSGQVVETMGFRVVQHWLDGPKKGQSETLIGSLPGFPDGITRSEFSSFPPRLMSPHSCSICLQKSCSHSVALMLTSLFAAGADGGYWVSLVAPLSPLVKLLPLGTTIRYALSHLLTSSLTKHIVKTWGCVIKLSASGEVLDTLMDTKGLQVSSVSAVTEFDGKLFLGNLMGDYVSVLSLADAKGAQ